MVGGAILKFIRNIKIIISIIVICFLLYGAYVLYMTYQESIGWVNDAGSIITGDETSHGSAIGKNCAAGSDCKGYRVPVGSKEKGVACCKNICQKTKKDYVGVWWCPHECKKNIFSKNGSC